MYWYCSFIITITNTNINSSELQATFSRRTYDEIKDNTKSSTTRAHNENKILQEHITVSVPNLASAKEWYSQALPLVEVPRNIKTAVKGAWYKFIDIPSLNVHLLEMKSHAGGEAATSVSGRDSADGAESTADITGQHIGLDLGKSIGTIRNELYDKGVTATLAAVTSTIKNEASGLQEEQQAIFLTGPGQMTWEFTNIFSPRQGRMKLVPSKVALPADRVGIPLNRSMSSSTTANTNVPTTVPSTGHKNETTHGSSDHEDKDNNFKFSISSGNPLATAAGYACLQAGGSAADATIAASAVMSIVEPYNGGLGGDFVAMIHDPANDGGSIKVLNGSGRAPSNAMPLPEHMKTVPKTGAESILSLPGAPSAWCRLHARYGKMPWKLILQPAIMMASEGFLLTERTAQVWEAAAKNVMDYDMSEEAQEEFLRMFAPPSGGHGERMSPRAGERYYNPTLAYTFQKFADGGCEWFYNEAVNEMLDHVEKRGGLLKKPAQEEHMRINVLEQSSWEEPLSTTYSGGNGTFEIFAAGGNSQAGSALLILNMLQGASTKNSREHLLHHHINAKRVVYRDTFRKAQYDQTMINNEEYVHMSIKEIQQAFRDSTSVQVDLQEYSHDTEGLVVRDSNGLTLSVLQSIAVPFGSGVVVPSLGFPLHGRGYGFDTRKGSNFSYVPGSRPWTTLSPFMVKKNGKFWMAASVKGGDRQPYAFTQIFLNIVELGYSPMEAVSLPRFRDTTYHDGNSKTVVEFDTPAYVEFGTPTYLLKNARLDDDNDKLYDYLNANGFECKRFIPREIEDSGFGVAQILIDDTNYRYHDPIGHSKAVSLTSLSDLVRKPGLALTGEQSSLVADDLNFPDEVVKLISPRDLEHITEPFRNFFKYHLHPLTDSELDILAKEGLSAKYEFKQIQQHGSKQRPLTIARNAEVEEGQDKGFKSLRHLSRIAKQSAEYDPTLMTSLGLDIRDVNSHLPEKFDAFFFQPGDYPTIALKSYIFPVGPLPLIGVDSYFDGLREHNPEIYRLLRPLVPEYMPALFDSREPQIMARENDFSMLNFPVVVKGEGNTAGFGVSIARNLAEFKQDMERRHRKSEDFVIQEALKGKDEFTLHFIGHYGRLLAVECFESTFDEKNDDGLHIKGKINKPNNRGRGFKGCAKEIDAIQIVDKILRGTLYNGFGCLQYKRNPDSDKVGIIEMNLRSCGGLFSDQMLKGYTPKVIRMVRRWIDANDAM